MSDISGCVSDDKTCGVKDGHHCAESLQGSAMHDESLETIVVTSFPRVLQSTMESKLG